MLESLRRQVDEAEAAVTRRNQLRANLTALGDELNALSSRIEALDVLREKLHEETNEARSLSLGGWLSSLLGRSEQSPAAAQEQFDAVDRRQADARRQIAEIEQQIRAAERELAEFGDVDAQLEHARREWKEARAAAGDEAVDSGAGAGDCGTMSAVEHAVRSAEHLKERLFSLTRSLGRARTGRMGRGPGAGLVNLVFDQRPGASVDRVRDGFERLWNDLTAIPLRDGDFTDSEIARLIPWISDCLGELRSRSTSAMVSDASVVGSLLDRVQEVLGHLKDKQSEMRRTLVTG